MKKDAKSDKLVVDNNHQHHNDEMKKDGDEMTGIN